MNAIAAVYVGRGVPVTEALHMLHLPRSTFYSAHVPVPSRAGRAESRFTVRMNGEETVFLPNETVVGEIRALLSQEFVCYGYKKVAKQLQRNGFIINRKKVLRLMAGNCLLNHPYNRRSPVGRVVELKVVVSTPNRVWEVDIKYVWIAGEERNAYLLAFIDCFTRESVGHYLGLHCNGDDVRETMLHAFHDRGIGNIGNVRIRNDNGTQLVCRTVENFLSMMNIGHERIHPHTPKEDAHIESFNSILEREVIRRFEFESLGDAEATINRFVEFYNTRRLHSAIGYRTPGEVYEEWKQEQERISIGKVLK